MGSQQPLLHPSGTGNSSMGSQQAFATPVWNGK